MVSRMAKPEEVLVVENEHGEVVREFMKDTDAINLYKTMRETLGMDDQVTKLLFWSPGQVYKENLPGLIRVLNRALCSFILLTPRLVIPSLPILFRERVTEITTKTTYNF